MQLHHWCFHAELMRSSSPSSALRTSPLHLPKEKAFSQHWHLGGCLGAIPELRRGSRGRAEHPIPEPEGSSQPEGSRARDPLSFADRRLFNTTPLINLTRQPVGQVLCFPEHTPPASQEFSLRSHKLPGSRHQEGRRSCAPPPPLPCAPTGPLLYG